MSIGLFLIVLFVASIFFIGTIGFAASIFEFIVWAAQNVRDRFRE